MKLVRRGEAGWNGAADVQLFDKDYTNAKDGVPGTLNIGVRNVVHAYFVSKQRVKNEYGVEFFIDEKSEKPKRHRCTYFVIPIEQWDTIVELTKPGTTQLQKQIELLTLSQRALLHDRDRHKMRSAKRLQQIRKLKAKEQPR